MATLRRISYWFSLELSASLLCWWSSWVLLLKYLMKKHCSRLNGNDGRIEIRCDVNSWRVLGFLYFGQHKKRTMRIQRSLILCISEDPSLEWVWTSPFNQVLEKINTVVALVVIVNTCLLVSISPQRLPAVGNRCCYPCALSSLLLLVWSARRKRPILF